jgi:hypothetical protein
MGSQLKRNQLPASAAAGRSFVTRGLDTLNPGAVSRQQDACGVLPGLSVNTSLINSGGIKVYIDPRSKR